jgi:hypothetical protein
MTEVEDQTVINDDEPDFERFGREDMAEYEQKWRAASLTFAWIDTRPKFAGT